MSTALGAINTTTLMNTAAESATLGWQVAGNAGTTDVTNFLGTTDGIQLNFRVNNLQSGRLDHVKFSTFFGRLSGGGAVIPTGTNNSAFGDRALNALTTGQANTAVGLNALISLTTANNNTAVGASALQNTTGAGNTALGLNAGFTNTTGTDNTYIGRGADGTAGLTNATAIGALASASQNNTVILGNAADIGIGTSTPTKKLDVVGDIKSSAQFLGKTGTEALPAYSFSGFTTAGMFSDAGGLGFATGGVERVFIGVFGSALLLFPENAGIIKPLRRTNAVGDFMIIEGGVGLGGTNAGAHIQLSGGAAAGATAYTLYPATAASSGGDVVIFGGRANGGTDGSVIIRNSLNTANLLSVNAAGNISITSGDLSFGTKSINTTAGDSATINSPTGRFRKDTSGSTFTLTNSFITANSIIILTAASDISVTGNIFSVVAGSGSAVITFWTAGGGAAAPTANQDINFLVIN